MGGRGGWPGFRRVWVVATIIMGLVASDAAMVAASPALAEPATLAALGPLSAGGVNELTPDRIAGDFSSPADAVAVPVVPEVPPPPSPPAPLAARPERVREVVGERSEFSSVWVNGDGSNTAE